jgi:hypothetical protein
MAPVAPMTLISPPIPTAKMSLKSLRIRRVLMGLPPRRPARERSAGDRFSRQGHSLSFLN